MPVQSYKLFLFRGKRHRERVVALPCHDITHINSKLSDGCQIRGVRRPLVHLVVVLGLTTYARMGCQSHLVKTKPVALFPQTSAYMHV